MRIVILFILIVSLVFSVELKNEHYSLSGELTLGEQPLPKESQLNSVDNIGRIVFKDREKKENLLIVFISSSPASRKVINEILALDKKIDLRVKYYMEKKSELVLENINENYLAEGGRLAVEENIRQIGIRKYYPEKYLPYLKLWSAAAETSYWQRMLSYVGVPVTELEQQIFSGSLAVEIDADIKLARELKIAATPAFFWQNQELIIDPEHLKQALAGVGAER